MNPWRGLPHRREAYTGKGLVIRSSHPAVVICSFRLNDLRWVTDDDFRDDKKYKLIARLLDNVASLSDPVWDSECRVNVFFWFSGATGH